MIQLENGQVTHDHWDRYALAEKHHVKIYNWQYEIKELKSTAFAHLFKGDVRQFQSVLVKLLQFSLGMNTLDLCAADWCDRLLYLWIS